MPKNMKSEGASEAESYLFEDGSTMKREGSNGFWFLRDPQGEVLDKDRYRHDLIDRHHLKIACHVDPVAEAIANDPNRVVRQLTSNQKKVLLAHNTAPGVHSAPKAGCHRQQGAVSQKLADLHGIFETRFEKANGLRWFKFTDFGLKVRLFGFPCRRLAGTKHPGTVA